MKTNKQISFWKTLPLTLLISFAILLFLNTILRIRLHNLYNSQTSQTYTITAYDRNGNQLGKWEHAYNYNPDNKINTLYEATIFIEKE